MTWLPSPNCLMTVSCLAPVMCLTCAQSTHSSHWSSVFSLQLPLLSFQFIIYSLPLFPVLTWMPISFCLELSGSWWSTVYYLCSTVRLELCSLSLNFMYSADVLSVWSTSSRSLHGQTGAEQVVYTTIYNLSRGKSSPKLTDHHTLFHTKYSTTSKTQLIPFIFNKAFWY